MDEQTTEIALTPVHPAERVLLLDVLRGFALFGVLWSNLNEWYGPTAPSSSLQYVLEWMQSWLLELRFYSLLGFLFGIGFATQLTRAEQRGGDVRGMFVRRMAALLGLGIVHGMLIWPGDVLTEYALVGATLVFFRRLSPRALLVSAAAMLTVVPYAINAAIVAVGWKFPQAPVQQQVAAIYAHGSFLEIIAQGTRSYLFWYQRWSSLVFPPFLALFLLGLWFVRVNGLAWLGSRRRLLWILGTSVAVWLGCLSLNSQLYTWWPGPKLRPSLNDLLFHAVAWRPIVMGNLRTVATWGNACTYAAALAILVSYPSGARRLGALAAVGRMSLTTYLTQSLICVTLFYGYGLGWYGRVGYDGLLAVTVCVFALQIAASAWWLRRFRFGPVEWLWRSAAYGKRQQLREIAARAAAV